ncbi:DUF4304 domain-containing protein [Pseudobacteroides cellulosolvens]|uniref:Uncharacterized protein n=1 Tax=Pseudobacteroides cellulosolvens ATCC 35603 = DSM 2933 TaxID=398512 RepID=A0A0L6JMA5_9FIRM|nr:DUF4304 domain-containing protein [Pseudobacteroides cellulosolvens]KNY26931.1 Protein of unknown function DUF4304 [Pseudobacteroides cellulosolvens ATCC 35603 = DSM 2933]
MYDQSFIQNSEYRKRFGDMEDITRKEADTLYKKIINEVASGLKQYGFRKSNSVTLERVNEYMIQILNFQRHTHLPTITINTAIRPLFINSTDDRILPLCKRLDKFDSKESSWYPIRRDTKTASGELLSIIINRVLPYFEHLDSPENIIHNREMLEAGEYTSPSSVILPCALKTGNMEVSILYLDKEIDRVNAQIAQGADPNEYRRYLDYFMYLKSLIVKGSFHEIYSLLKSYEKAFLEKKYKKKS